MEFLKTEEDLGAPAPIRLFTLEGLGLPEDELLEFLRNRSVKLEWDDYDVKLAQVEYLHKVLKPKIDKNPHLEKLLADFLRHYYSGELTLESMTDIIDALTPEQQHRLESIKPRRKRSIAQFQMAYSDDVNDGNWLIMREPAHAFQQNVGVGDIRRVERKFKETSRAITANQHIIRYIELIASLTREVCAGNGGNHLRIAMHRMFVVGDIMQEGSNAYEGMHQDGADYIVSAMVISRHDIVGGVSKVCDETGENIYLEHTLKPGQGIFQADSGSPLWHDVSPIRYDPNTPALDGFRDILGFDIYVLDKDVES